MLLLPVMSHVSSHIFHEARWYNFWCSSILRYYCILFVFAGELFAQAPVEQYPGSVVEAVTDSSRYFVIRIEDGNGKTF